MQDARNYQIAILAILLAYGLWQLNFDLTWSAIGITLGTVLSAQWLAARLRGLSYNFRSPLISGLSLCLLLRTDALWVYGLAGCVTIFSKFIIRYHDKHIFNPTAFGIVVVLTTGHAWVAGGQWGSVTLLAFFASCLGLVVVQRASRWDISLAFIVSYGGLLLLRTCWLGDPMAIFWHQIQNGAIILFAFFMISDPKTTPNSRVARILFAFLVAAGALAVQFGLYRENGLFWTLILGSFGVPFLDYWLPGPHYRWPINSMIFNPTPKSGRSYEAAYP